MTLNRREFTALGAFLLASQGLASSARAQADPLPSWNGGHARTRILDFVARVTNERGADYVSPAERIAAFDNDGTLWAEQPIYFQAAFALDRVKSLAAQRPELQGREPFKSIIENDMAAIEALGQKELLEVIAVTHAGMTTEEFAGSVVQWLRSARHPRFDRPYDTLVYQPMLELLVYLRANGFKTFIVSGGGVEFMRAFAERTYDIPPEQVVGSSLAARFEIRTDGNPVLIKEPKIEFVDDGPGKPVGINRFIGRRPILSFGNSDGDLEMLQWTAAGAGLRLMGLVHHDDSDREWAYDRQSHVGKLDKALDDALARGWTLVSMRRDWTSVFPRGP
jgi:phosphoglycolate phosphatase-like HAD superfamily hydrolase